MRKTVLITGGAGFIGANACRHYITQGRRVIILDNLQRAGSSDNLNWLKNFGEFKLVKGDIRDSYAIKKAFFSCGNSPDIVLHLAAQVAVTTSVLDPLEDFKTNAAGTVLLLEAARKAKKKPVFLFASTNKVYGKLRNIGIIQKHGRYAFQNKPRGIPESQPLDFHSPYGCSKGAADQYVIDYARIYNLPTVVFRQSCIYGTRQWGMEDQGWLAHFIISAVSVAPVNIYGNGRQVRDILHVSDLIRAYDLAHKRINSACGQVLNIGGGHRQTISLLESLDMIGRYLETAVPRRFRAWRPGDQEVFISDIAKAKKLLGWTPQIPVTQGVRELIDWVRSNKSLIAAVKNNQKC